MSIFTEEAARRLLDKVLALSKAEECSVGLTGSVQGNIRFALNDITTCGSVSNAELTVQSAFGKRVGIASTNQFDDVALRQVVIRSEELAKLAPESTEFMPAVKKQSYRPSRTYSQATAQISPGQRAKIAANSISPARSAGLISAGFLEHGHRFTAIANSNGNFAYQEGTELDYTCTVRTGDGQGSGWVGRSLQEVSQLEVGNEVQTAIRKAKGTVGARALEPGKYTVILEPAAGAGLVSLMASLFDARQADEGRSFLSRKGGGTKLGEQVFDRRVQIFADPWNAEAPALPWDGEGLARQETPLVKDGKVTNLLYSRYWANKQGREEVGAPGNLIMGGGDGTTEELIGSTERGILVTRTWYVRMVDTQTVLLTGLTRDGTFLIEDGKIAYPVKNFRFNESPVLMLNNIEELGKPVRVAGDQNFGAIVVPPMKLRDFTFTSLSDAV